MEKLTPKEEEIMEFYWAHGPLFVKQLLGFFHQPKPHYNTLSTITRNLEEKGYLGYKDYGTVYQYYPLFPKEEYTRKNLRNVVQKYFGSSYKRVVSAFAEEENISVEELKEIIRDIENRKKSK
jgi:BlaI family transcriptional regulator, penicillinase repressor